MSIPKLNINIRKWSQDMWVLRVGIWKSKDPPLIRTEINGGPPVLIQVFTLTCFLPCKGKGTYSRWREHFFVFWSMKVELIGIHIIKTQKLIGQKIKIREMCRPYLTFYPPLDNYPNNIVTISVSFTLNFHGACGKMILPQYFFKWRKESLLSYHR